MVIKNRKILLVAPLAPQNPHSFWDCYYALSFLGKKAPHIPLGLITMAGYLKKILKPDWEFRLIDLNIGQKLTAEALDWADTVMVSGMEIHQDSIVGILEACRFHRKLVIVGGPFASATPDHPKLALADALFVGEVEGSRAFARLIDEIDNGELTERVYRDATPNCPDLDLSPVPLYELLQTDAYVAMSMQASRGCPMNCSYCLVTRLYGRRMRYKRPDQCIDELEAIKRTGFRGNVFLVDDNLPIVPKKVTPILEAFVRWRQSRKNRRRFLFYTQTSIHLAEDPALVKLVVQAGIFAVFIGFESPSAKALASVDKRSDLSVERLAELVRSLREAGLLVWGGFMVGFDTDGLDCFDQTKAFIDGLGISVALVSIMNAIPGTELHQSLLAAGRLAEITIHDSSYDTNVVPLGMTRSQLIAGALRLNIELYRPEEYFRRAAQEQSELRQPPQRGPTAVELRAGLISVWRQGLCPAYRRVYWSFIRKHLLTRLIGRAFATAILGHHYIVLAQKEIRPLLEKSGNGS